MSSPRTKGVRRHFSFQTVLDFTFVFFRLIYIYYSHYLSLWTVQKETVMELSGYQDSSNCARSLLLHHFDV